MISVNNIFQRSKWLLVAGSCFAVSAFAQEQPSLLKRADTHFARQEFAPAAALYERVLQKKKDALPLMEKVAASYKGINQYGKAADWYGRITQLPEAGVDNWLYYGDMLKSQGSYAAAKTAYETYRQKGGTSTLLSNRIAGCDSAQLWQQQNNGVLLRNVAVLNTGKSDWGAVPYENALVFVSDSMRKQVLSAASRPNKRYYARNNHAFLKLYQASPARGGWGYVNAFAPAMNQYRYHTGPAIFSKNGDTAYVTVTDPDRMVFDKSGRPVLYGVRRLELLVFIRKGQQWQSPQPFAYNKPQEYSLGHAALSPDGSILYFVTDMPGGQGGTDLWYSRKNSDGSWGVPQSCGSQINTAGAEEFPTVAADGTLYFSSTGHTGMGGLDLFRATGDGDQWSVPVNMRTPFNSPADDFYYVSTVSGAGYLSSNRTGGKGDDDIYSLALPATLQPVIPVQPLLRIPLEATVCISNTCVYLFNKKREIGWCYMPSPPEHKITAMLEADTEYVIRVYSGGRLVSSTDFNTNGLTGAEVLRKAVCPGK